MQSEVMHTASLQKFMPGMNCELFSEGEVDGVPRYSLTIIDHSDKDIAAKKDMGVFVVPLGLEREMDIYGAGKMKLSNTANMSRLIVVVLGKGHKYESLEKVQ